MHLPSPYGIRLIKGSHIVVPRVHTQKQAYILRQNEDKRIVFVIPWMGRIPPSSAPPTGVQRRSGKRREIDESGELPAEVCGNALKKQLSRDDTWSDLPGASAVR